jgi:hypothetical protein
MTDTLYRLTDINLDDLVNSFGWQDNPLFARALRILFHGVAKKFARQMLEYDRNVGETDLALASRGFLRHYVDEVCTFGEENIPGTGPLLVLSNHPGMTDTLCLFSAIHRPDLRVIALDRPFLQALPNVSRHLFYVSGTPSERMSAVRKTATHLRNGGAALTFPAGRIEPDPEVYPGALEALNGWTDSAGIFMRLVPATGILPVLVRRVLWRRVVTNPITKIKHDQAEREKMGAAFQLLAHVLLDLHPLKVTVQFGQQLTLDAIGSSELPVIHASVLAGMRTLMENPPVGMGNPVLQPTA